MSANDVVNLFVHNCERHENELQTVNDDIDNGRINILSRRVWDIVASADNLNRSFASVQAVYITVRDELHQRMLYNLLCTYARSGYFAKMADASREFNMETWRDASERIFPPIPGYAEFLDRVQLETRQQIRVGSETLNLCKLAYSNTNEQIQNSLAIVESAVGPFTDVNQAWTKENMDSYVFKDFRGKERCVVVIEKVSLGRVKKLLCFFTGTESWCSPAWATNLDRHLEPIEWKSREWHCHRGFLKMLNHLWNESIIKMDDGENRSLEGLINWYASSIDPQQDQSIEAFVVGHSLGGALAQLFTARVADMSEIRRVTAWTMAAPGVFDKGTADKFNDIHKVSHVRLYHYRDTVPWVHWLYRTKHTGRAVPLQSVSCWDRFRAYIPVFGGLFAHGTGSYQSLTGDDLLSFYRH